MNMPGAHLAMWGMGKIFGWEDLGFRVFDLLCLASICVSTFFWLRQAGRRAAVAAPTAFALWYLGTGPVQSLQREYLALVPLTAMLATSAPGPVSGPRLLLVGVLAGTTFTLKPHLLLLALPLLGVVFRAGQPSSRSWQTLMVFGAGVFLPIGAMVVYLLATQSLKPFLEIVLNYWPLYTHMTGDHTPIAGFDRIVYLVRGTRNGLMTFYTPMAVVGLLVLDDTQDSHRLRRLLLGLLIAAAMCPALAGQFWDYHWIPFHYVALCAAALAARPIATGGAARIASVFLLVFLLFALSSRVVEGVRWQWTGHGEQAHVKEGVPDEIAQYLVSHLKIGDTVQPLDWTGGAVHGMLMARAPLATRFMYDFHFYHHIDSPYIRRLRREFVHELTVTKPKFIIQVLAHRPWPQGPHTTRDFPELQAFLEQYYETAQQGSTYRILQRKSDLPQPLPEHPPATAPQS